MMENKYSMPAGKFPVALKFYRNFLSMNAEYLLLPVAAYFIGAVPFGFLIGKWYHVDIRKAGSGNIGATNVTRVVGKKAGKLCFFLDFVKGALPVALAAGIAPETPELALAAAIAAILGHIFPIYLKFRGGKGVSTAAGAAFALAPYPLLVALAVWVAVFLIGRYVSLASILAAVTMPVAAWIFSHCGIGVEIPLPTLIFFTAAAIVAILRHTENIKRLLNGTESRFERKNNKVQ